MGGYVYVKIIEDTVGRMHWHKVEYTQLGSNWAKWWGGGAQRASRKTVKPEQ